MATVFPSLAPQTHTQAGVKPDPTAAAILPNVACGAAPRSRVLPELVFCIISAEVCNCRLKGQRRSHSPVEDSVFAAFFRPVLALFLPNLKCSVFTEQ